MENTILSNTLEVGGDVFGQSLIYNTRESTNLLFNINLFSFIFSSPALC